MKDANGYDIVPGRWYRHGNLASGFYVQVGVDGESLYAVTYCEFPHQPGHLYPARGGTARFPITEWDAEVMKPASQYNQAL